MTLKNNNGTVKAIESVEETIDDVSNNFEIAGWTAFVVFVTLVFPKIPIGIKALAVIIEFVGAWTLWN